jgi:hypothetical protein
MPEGQDFQGDVAPTAEENSNGCQESKSESDHESQVVARLGCRGCVELKFLIAGHCQVLATHRIRKTTWKEFLSRHWELIVAADFFTVEVWTRRGLRRFMVLFLMELSTRKVEVAGIAAGANGLWMSQIGRNLTNAGEGILHGKRYLIHDRDPLFTTEFLEMLADVGVCPSSYRRARRI